MESLTLNSASSSASSSTLVSAFFSVPASSSSLNFDPNNSSTSSFSKSFDFVLPVCSGLSGDECDVCSLTLSILIVLSLGSSSAFSLSSSPNKSSISASEPLFTVALASLFSSPLPTTWESAKNVSAARRSNVSNPGEVVKLKSKCRAWGSFKECAVASLLSYESPVTDAATGAAPVAVAADPFDACSFFIWIDAFRTACSFSFSSITKSK